MATSGQIGQTTYTLQELLDAGFRACRIPAQNVSAEMLENGRATLQRFLSALPAGIVLGWGKERLVLPVAENKRFMILPPGTLEISNVQLRTYERFTATLTDNNTNLRYDIGGQGMVTAIGIRPAITGEKTITIETSTDAADWNPAISQTVDFVAGEMKWFELDQFALTRYIRVTGLLGFEIRTFFIAGQASENDISLCNQDDYSHLPSTSQGPPSQYYFDRRKDHVRLWLWPIPDATVRNCSISLWRQRQIEDVGDYTQEIEIPQRWYKAVIAALAYELAYDNPSVDISVVNWLKPKADEALSEMEEAEPDRSPIRFHTAIRRYTR